MLHGRLLTTALAVAATMAIAPAWAAADPSPLVDNSVRSTSFDGTTLPAGVTAITWDTEGPRRSAAAT